MVASQTIDSNNNQLSVNLWEGRKYLYGLIGTVFARPIHQEWLLEFASDAFATFMQTLELSPAVIQYYQAVLEVIKLPQNERTKWIEETHLEYDRLFIVPTKNQFVPLGASVYVPDGTDLDQRRTFLEELYKKFGFEWKEFMRDTPGVWPNEPEHIVLVLPMLAILAEEVANSLRENDEFLETLLSLFQQLLRMTKDWVPACVATIEKATDNPFYKLFARILGESLEVEYGLLTCSN